MANRNVHEHTSDALSRLVGTSALIKGTVLVIRHKNPYTRSKNKYRQTMVLLKPVQIACVEYDHLWLMGTKALVISLTPGDSVELFARVGVYSQPPKIGVRFPYKYIKKTHI